MNDIKWLLSEIIQSKVFAQTVGFPCHIFFTYKHYTEWHTQAWGSSQRMPPLQKKKKAKTKKKKTNKISFD